ncbi:hypothetical protein [Streptococcus gallolyticus]|uniref:hypothetical protein n=1 Tax=Streptococcus gallolyticus TaxID=315405 RepID=UPI002283E695|nr:hypothetical protein [Streptococcus gallolyticus]MCY7179255.1 hypothetical protein [Streptococcus gallolyticus subsp. gallolyticus]
MRKYLKEVKKLKELTEELKTRELPFCIVINGSEELGEFFEVDGELFNDNELLENIKKWKEWEVPIVIEDWTSRDIDIEKLEILYFPTQEDFIDYTRVKKDLAPLYHELGNSYTTISKSEWLKMLGR